MSPLRPFPTETLDRASADDAYSRWAPIYDLIFDLPFHPGRLAAATAASRAAGAHGEILVVGVGTGLELGLISRETRVTGVDLSAPMLKVARDRVEREAFGHVKSLQVMDAGAMTFADSSFDVTLAPYVMSVVPDVAKVLDEIFRVTKPGGEIVLMNHFAATSGPRAYFEAAMETSAAWLGWHPNFPYAAVGDWIASRKDVGLMERRELAPFKLFTLLRLRKIT